MLRLALFSAACLCTGAARAAETPPCEVGVWSGKVGNAEVRMEFDERGDRLVGRYYYRQTLADLLLQRDEKTGDWQELEVDVDDKGRTTGRLRLSCSGDGLSGQWSSPDGAKVLPLVLKRSAEGYGQHRLAGLKPPVAKPARIDGFRATPLTVPGLAGMQSVQINLGDARFARLNAQLWTNFVGEVDKAVECVGQGLMRYGPGHEYEYASTTDLLLGGRELVVLSHSAGGHCGGAHPFGGSGATVWRIADGERVEVKRWFNANALEAGLETILRREHAKAIDEPECAKEIRFDLSSAWPGPNAMVFQPWTSHAMRLCVHDVELPYATVRRYLSAEGKAALANFREAR